MSVLSMRNASTFSWLPVPYPSPRVITFALFHFGRSWPDCVLQTMDFLNLLWVKFVFTISDHGDRRSASINGRTGPYDTESHHLFVINCPYSLIILFMKHPWCGIFATFQIVFFVQALPFPCIIIPVCVVTVVVGFCRGNLPKAGHGWCVIWDLGVRGRKLHVS